MTRLRVSPDLTLPDDAVTHTFVIFGKRGSGKSNTAVVLAEEMHRVGAPFAVLDPISAWWGLKSSADGSGPGLPVYVFGGPHGDLPLEPSKGELMARVFIEHRIPMVLDMKGWTGLQRAGFVTAFTTFLLGNNDRVPSHVFMEEADAFVPQRPFKGEEAMLGAADRLVRWGRQEGLGATLITQRSAKVNKDVTTQADTLIAHRTIGPQDRDAIDEWIKFHAAGEQRQNVLSTLATLPDGTAWVWSPEWLEILKQVAFRRRGTYDSAATPRLGERRAAPKKLAEVDVERLRGQLADTVEQAKANDPAELRKRIRELEATVGRLESRPAPVPETVEKIVEVPVLNGEVDDLRGAALSLIGVADQILAVGTNIVAAIDRVSAAPRSAHLSVPVDASRRASGGRSGAPRGEAIPRTRGIESATTIDPARQAVAVAPTEPGDARKLKAGARRMLSALAWFHPSALTRPQLAMMTDISPISGTVSDYLSAMRLNGLIVESGNGTVAAPATIGLSDAGLALVADELGDAPPSTPELVEMWGRKVKAGARKMLQALVDEYPRAFSRPELAEVAGISNISGTTSDYLSALRRAGLLDESGDGIRANGNLFLDGRS